MSDSHTHILVLGAGHAGDSVAALLRQYGWQGQITLAGNEGLAPYQRPPLSKAMLLGQMTADNLALRSDTFYTQQKITLLTNSHAIAIKREERKVAFGNGEEVSYDHLILATGSRLRPLNVPGTDLKGIKSLRTLPDASALREEVRYGRRVVIVGGGYIGLEAAASASKLGATVTVVEREERLLARVASPFLSRFVRDYQESHDVAIELNASVTGFKGDAGHLTAVLLADGRSLPCDLALVGIGVLAEQTLAQNAGLECSDGVVVDARARTSDSRIYAIGDCTRRPMGTLGGMVRLESVHNATEQAKQAACDLCGRTPPAIELPWTWSDQFDLRLQLAGLVHGSTEAVVRGDPAKNSFAVFHLDRNGSIEAVEAVNAPMEFAFARMMSAKGICLPHERLRDPSVQLKELMQVPLS